MRYFVGTWEFRIWGGNDTARSADLSGTWVLENRLDSAVGLVGRVVLNDGPGVQGGPFTSELIAFDGHTNEYIRTIITNTGALYTFRSSGWKGDQLLWMGEQRTAAGVLELREEITLLSPSRFKAVFHRKDKEGWVVQTTEDLVRRKAQR